MDNNIAKTPKFDISFIKWYNIIVAFKGGNKILMKNDDKASISLKKIVCISIILIFLLGIGVMAGNIKVNNVKIVLSSGYEMNVLTTKTTIKDILEENHIILLEDEKVIPSMEEELSDNKTIMITKAQDDVVEIATEVENSSNVTTEDVLQNYSKIVEKIVKEKVEIPFETVKKDVSTSTGSKVNQVVQTGKNGLKEVTYKVKYQNDKEIEKKEISSKIIKKPVNKIIEVRTRQQVTSRGSSGAKVRYGGKWSYSAAELDLLCAITAQECSRSYNGALAVITCAANRAESKRWRRNGSDPLRQYKARGQFCYSIDNHWRKRLNGNYPSHVKRAVIDALNGKRNHNYLSFRAAGYARGVNIGGNVYFNAM